MKELNSDFVKVKVYLSIIAFFIFNYSYSQKSDFVATDSSLNAGINLIKGTPRDNSQHIRLKSKGEDITYTPHDITEYGFKDGTIYQAHKIQLDGEEKNVFLERLVLGKITLYRYVDKTHKTFFLKKDSAELTELLPSMEAFKTLSSDCEFISDANKLASYKKPSLIKLVSNYNKCKQRPFPFNKFGVIAGFNQMLLIKPSKFQYQLIEDVSFEYSGSPLIGIFTDLPIFMSDFSFHSSISITKNSYSSNAKSDDSDIDVIINLTTLSVPILFRYTYPSINWRPFINAGYLLQYNLQNEGDIYESTITSNIVTINRPVQTELISDFAMGYSIGLGIQYNLNYRKSLSGEVRYSKSFGSKSTLSQAGLNLVIGFTF